MPAPLFNSVSDEYLITPAELRRDGPSPQPRQRRRWGEGGRPPPRLMGAQFAFIPMNHAFVTSLQPRADAEETRAECCSTLPGPAPARPAASQAAAPVGRRRRCDRLPPPPPEARMWTPPSTIGRPRLRATLPA